MQPKALHVPHHLQRRCQTNVLRELEGDKYRTFLPSLIAVEASTRQTGETGIDMVARNG